VTGPSLDRVAQAALNNARWCDAVCRAHGLRTELTDELWMCHDPPPRFYSRATTLGAQPAVEARLRSLLERQPEPASSVKDGFFRVDLTDLGFTELFQADWLWHPPARDGPTSLAWERVVTDAALLAWEAVWEGAPRPVGQARQFPPTLLEDPDIAFLAGRRDGAIAVVSALNRSGPVVGLSNAAGADAASDDGWADHAAVAARLFPGLPVVGYERGADLEAAQRHGFTSIGPLRVWVPPEG